MHKYSTLFKAHTIVKQKCRQIEIKPCSFMHLFFIYFLEAEFIDYLPKDQGSTKQFGGIDVTVKQITENPDYILTDLSIVEGKVRRKLPFFV